MSSSHLEKIEALLQTTASAQGPDFRLAIARLLAEVKQRVKSDSPSSFEFCIAAVRALSRMRGTAHADARMTCLNDIGLFLYVHGHSEEALSAVRDLERLATLTNLKPWLRKAGNLSGMVNADLGNVADAVIRYSEALAIAIEIEDVAGELAVLANLGVALNYGGFYREAIPCFNQVAALLRIDTVNQGVSKSGFSPDEFGRAALTNLAQSYLALEQYEKGFAAICECLANATEPKDSATACDRTIREFTFVQLALELGKFDLARMHSKVCSTYGARAGRRGQFLANITQGLCEVYSGQVNIGLEILETSLASSGEGGVFRVDALAALGKAYEQANQPERALECLHELSTRIRAAREKGILVLLSLPSVGGLDSRFTPDEDDLRALKCKEADLRAKVAEKEVINSRIEMLERLAVAADLKEEVSGEHGYRVGKLASLLAEDINWNHDACFAIDLAARLHDIGKIGVPDRILLNATSLKYAEHQFMSKHTVIGAELLAKSNIPQLRMAEEIARLHHEWWDGSGYPSKLAGKRIPIHARIVALCDVFDALTHGRPYAEAWPIDRALEEIRMRRGTQFDPELSDGFLALIERLRTEHADLDAYLGKAGRNSPFLQARHKIKLLLNEEREKVERQQIPRVETVH